MNTTKDNERFEAVFVETEAQVRAYIAGMGVPRWMVDDIAQDVYVAYWKQKESIPEDLEPIRWLKGIARNMSVNYFTRSKARGAIHLQAISQLLAEYEEDSTHSERSVPRAYDELMECVAKLSEKNRKLLALRYEDDSSSDQIANIMGATAEGVRVTLLRIRAVLRNCVERVPAQGGGR